MSEFVLSFQLASCPASHTHNNTSRAVLKHIFEPPRSLCEAILKPIFGVIWNLELPTCFVLLRRHTCLLLTLQQLPCVIVNAMWCAMDLRGGDRLSLPKAVPPGFSPVVQWFVLIVCDTTRLLQSEAADGQQQHVCGSQLEKAAPVPVYVASARRSTFV